MKKKVPPIDKPLVTKKVPVPKDWLEAKVEELKKHPEEYIWFLEERVRIRDGEIEALEAEVERLQKELGAK